MEGSCGGARRSALDMLADLTMVNVTHVNKGKGRRSISAAGSDQVKNKKNKLSTWHIVWCESNLLLPRDFPESNSVCADSTKPMRPRSCSACQSSLGYENTKITQHALTVSEFSVIVLKLDTIRKKKKGEQNAKAGTLSLSSLHSALPALATRACVTCTSYTCLLYRH